MKYVQLLYHYQINSLNLFVKDITAFIEIHQFICFLQAFKQWGLSSETSNGDSTISITYPITFSVFNVVVPALYSTSGHKQHEGGGGDGITKSDLKGFSFYHGSDIRNCKLYWFAIGKQLLA